MAVAVTLPRHLRLTNLWLGISAAAIAPRPDNVAGAIAVLVVR